MVLHPLQYRWSSHRAYLGDDEHTWLAQDLVVRSFGQSDNIARGNLAEYICLDDELAAIRKSYMCGAYGDPSFIEEFRQELGIEGDACDLVDSDLELSLQELTEVTCTCTRFGLTLQDLRSDSRHVRLIEARTVLGLLAKNLGVESTSSVARFIQRDPTSLAKLVRNGQGNTAVKKLVGSLREEILLSIT